MKKINKTKLIFLGIEKARGVSFLPYIEPVFDWLFDYLNDGIKQEIEGAMVHLTPYTMLADWEKVPDWSWFSFSSVFSSSIEVDPAKADVDVYLKSPAGLLHITANVTTTGVSGSVCFEAVPFYRYDDFSPLFDVVDLFNQYRSSTSDCRSEESITKGLISSLISICRVLVERDLSPLVVQEALLDLLGNEDLMTILDEAKKVHMEREKENNVE